MSTVIRDKKTSQGEKLESLLKDLVKKEALAGFWEGESTEPNGQDTALTAAVQEYGNSTTPPKPFTARSVDDFEDELEASIETAIDGIFNLNSTDDILEEMAESQKLRIKESILTGDFESSNPTPLIDSGTMFDAITAKVLEKGNRE